MNHRAFHFALSLLSGPIGMNCLADEIVKAGQVQGGEYVYQFNMEGEEYDASAMRWNDTFGGDSTNARAHSEVHDNLSCVFIANYQPASEEMEVVMRFDFSQSGHEATGVSGGHWMQKFLTDNSQAYYQRFFSINDGEPVLIDESPAWGQFPNSGDDAETGFLKNVFMGAQESDPLVFAEPARTFVYRILVKFQDRESGDPAAVRTQMVQPIRAGSEEHLKRAQMKLSFSLQPSK